MNRAVFLARAGMAAGAVYAEAAAPPGWAIVPRPAKRGPAETLIIAHRGASSAAPENSLEAFDLAIAAGADMIEFDVRRTRDDYLIVFHDADLGGAPVGQLTRGEVGEQTGMTPPVLDEVLEFAQGRVKLNVELKEDGYVERVMTRLSDYLDPQEIVVTSFLDAVLIQVKRLAEVKTGLLLGVDQPGLFLRTELGSLFPAARLRRCGADYVAAPIELADSGVIGRTALGELPALVWTVNDRETIVRCLVDERIAGIITDVPARARALRDQTARWARD